MVFTLLTILLILITWELRCPRKKGGNRKSVHWNRGLRNFCTLVLRFLFFYSFFADRKNSYLFFYSLLVNVSIGGENFESCSAWEGANGLPCGRKGCRGGDWRSEKLYRYLENELHHVSKNAALPQVFFCHILRTVPKDF